MMDTTTENARTGEGPGRARGQSRNEPRHYTASGLAAPLLARLEGVIPAGPGKWYARCPAHDDKSPSLSVADKGDRVLIHCFAGCDPSDALTAVGLDWKDIYPDRWVCAERRPNEAARKHLQRALADLDPMDHERSILKFAAADRRAGIAESIEGRARVEVAVLRLRAAGGVS